MGDPPASIVIPTAGGRADYLAIALASIVPQARHAGAEVVIVDDGADPATGAAARRHGARYLRSPAPGGLNASRNAGVSATRAGLVVFVDDDVEVHPGWLGAYLGAAREDPPPDALGGPIHARLEGIAPRTCGRHPPPVTSLDLGSADRDAERVWGANMAIRRDALERVGPFDERIRGCGDEEDWERRLLVAGGRIRYVARAAVDHRRAPRDSGLGALMRAAHARGRAARAYDAHRGRRPPAVREVRVLAGCLWHAARRRCANGLIVGAHSAGRLREAAREALAARGPAAAAGTGGPASPPGGG